MTHNDLGTTTFKDWRIQLPVLSGRLVVLREPTGQDLEPLVDLLSTSDATRFGLDEPVDELAVGRLIEGFSRDRAHGIAFTYGVTMTLSRVVVGLIQVRQLDPLFSGAQWECTLLPSARGTGIFLEAARLVGSFSFGSVGAYRLEARTRLHNGRANGALRKLGAVQEGILRGSLGSDGENDQLLWSMLRDDWGAHWISTAASVH